ncbi:MAG TPA: HAMP domain-containing sensor histidine kinase, partial [Longimicrobiales bacterium]|nr:HAMP domain-containing sensor histidine kinase [Longimicrobiales bacterium]
TFSDARSAERRIWSDLAPLARNLGIEVHEQFVETRTLAEFWHQRLNEDALLRRGRAGLELLLETDVRARFAEVLQATGTLDSTIVRVTQRERERILEAERLGLKLTFVSGALALVAAVVVALLGVRGRRLAAQSERRRQETAAALEASARAADARERLVRGITHDVKNPLGAARGYAELLSMGVKGSLNPEQEKLVQGMQRSVDSALAIISDLLDLARTDSGGITVQRTNTDLNQLVREAVEDHRAAAEAAGHAIKLEASGEPLTSYTDAVRVRRVLDNLITNAIKYTPAPGRIVVRTEGSARDAPVSRRAAAIRVADTGPGIPPEKREAIFDEFTRLTGDDGPRGHGLGLAIARRVARVLGGEVGIAKSDGTGATFVLWLPQRE